MADDVDLYLCRTIVPAVLGGVLAAVILSMGDSGSLLIKKSALKRQIPKSSKLLYPASTAKGLAPFMTSVKV